MTFLTLLTNFYIFRDVLALIVVLMIRCVVELSSASWWPWLSSPVAASSSSFLSGRGKDGQIDTLLDLFQFCHSCQIRTCHKPDLHCHNFIDHYAGTLFIDYLELDFKCQTLINSPSDSETALGRILGEMPYSHRIDILSELQFTLSSYFHNPYLCPVLICEAARKYADIESQKSYRLMLRGLACELRMIC